MISLEAVEADILELEAKDTSLAVCQRLAILYIVRDHLRQYRHEQPDPLRTEGRSEFLAAVNGKNTAAVWTVMDNLAETLQRLHPRLYASLLDNINSI